MPKEQKNKKHFFRDFKAEIKKVIWPTPKQLMNNTIAVIVIVAICAIIVFVLDLVFESGNKFGVDKLKTLIRSNDKVTSEEVDGNIVTSSDIDIETNGANENSNKVSEDAE